MNFLMNLDMSFLISRCMRKVMHLFFVYNVKTLREHKWYMNFLMHVDMDSLKQHVIMPAKLHLYIDEISINF